MQTPEQKENEKMWGPLASTLAAIKFPLHLYSFAIGQVVAFSILTGYLSTYGIPANRYTNSAAIIFGGLLGMVIEYLHHELPRPGWRLMFDWRNTLKAPGKIIMLALILSAGYGLTQLSSLLTAKGGEVAARSFYDEPAAPDLSRRVSDYRRDSSAVAAAYAGKVAAINTDYDGRVSSAKAKYQPVIDRYTNRANNDAKLNAVKHPWGPGSAKNFRRKAADQQSLLAGAIDKINADRAAALAPVISDQSSELLALSKSLRGDVSAVREGYKSDVAKAKAANDNMAGFGYDLGGYVVWALFIMSFFLELYDHARGKRYEGFAFNPARRASRLWENLSGIFADKADHSISRLAATRKNLKTRNEAKPFAWPSGHTVFIGLSICSLAFFIAETTIPFADESYHANAMLGAPWSWVGVILSVIALIFGAKKEGKQRQVADSPAPVSEPEDKAQSVADNTPESVVRQQSEAVPDDDESEVNIATPDEIRKAKDRCRKYYVRQFTSSTRTGQDNNADKYRQERKVLRSWGYKVSASGPIEKRSVKVEGRPELVTFKRLVISE
jgi:hypothetical protein